MIAAAEVEQIEYRNRIAWRITELGPKCQRGLRRRNSPRV